MRLLLYADPHWCQYSSIVRSRGMKYSTRLENEIASINWVQILAEEQHCDRIICLGDFFDKESLNSEEISALSEIEWSNIPNYFLVGNHEAGINTLEFNSSNIFRTAEFMVISVPRRMIFTEDINTEICFLPYILENKRKSINDYFGEKRCKRRIILSHNDLKGIQMGQFLSTSGFDLSDIEANCDRFINGHLHNGTRISEKIFNIGNLTGQNFSEDATKYTHSCFILDTETLSIDVFDNPNAFNFYKIDNNLNIDLNYPAVVTIKIKEDQKEELNHFLESNKDKIIEKRIIIQTELLDKQQVENSIKSLSINHIEEFNKFIISQYGDSEIIKEELSEVSR